MVISRLKIKPYTHCKALPSLEPQSSPLLAQPPLFTPRHMPLRSCEYQSPILPSSQPTVEPISQPSTECSIQQVTNLHEMDDSQPPLEMLPFKYQACIVKGCPEHIAPTMWRAHLSLHARGVFPDTIPFFWLEQQGLFVCHLCCQLESECNATSHLSKFSSVVPPSMIVTVDRSAEEAATLFPSLVDVFQLRTPTLHHMPANALPAFASVLTQALCSVIHDNTMEAWIKLLLLPKCCLPSTKRKGRHNKPIDIKMLCDLWSRGQFGVLWRLAICHSKVGSATKSGKLLESKHPQGPITIHPKSFDVSVNIPHDLDKVLS